MECYKNKFSGVRCRRPATSRGAGTGNGTDNWTWCDAHKRPAPWSVPIPVESLPRNGKKEARDA
jgi:hypothetical protein